MTLYNFLHVAEGKWIQSLVYIDNENNESLKKKKDPHTNLIYVF